ncbi:MAG: chromosome partitioning ATPase [Candidatus Accumulibacter sp.]|nr:chromosome partitioning ATPase [Accumulibacter sp.]
MSLIEQAAKRLEELRLAGVAIPEAATPPGPPPPELLPSEAVAATPPAPARHPRSDEVAAPLPATGDSGPSRRVELDLAALSASGIIRPDAPRSQVADEYRVIKRPLIANAMGKGAAPIANGNLIMVTSALPGEGKSFTAANLAMSIAMELDNTVMLVDADVSRPSLLRMMGLPPAPGLLDILVDESIDLRQVLLRTNVEKLSILPSGTQHARATELLASDAMARLLEDMASRYSDRIIIFDSPPLLVTTEARVLASHMGQVVVVVKAEGTAQGDVKHALAAIEGCPVKLMLLNQAKSGPQGSYGYGYGYGYGS